MITGAFTLGRALLTATTAGTASRVSAATMKCGHRECGHNALSSGSSSAARVNCAVTFMSGQR